MDNIGPGMRIGAIDGSKGTLIESFWRVCLTSSNDPVKS